jgi:valyl-tRNA synthetase
VNWSCQLRSAISDIEVDHQSIDGPQGISVPGYDKPVTFGYIYKFDYKLSDSDERIAVSTTRPGKYFLGKKDRCKCKLLFSF